MTAATAPTGVRAQAWLLGRRIDVRWTNPTASAFEPGTMQTGVRVVRRAHAFPLGPDDGDVVYEGPVVDHVVDDSLTPGVRYYYTLFARTGSALVTSDEARGHALATGYGDLPERLFGMLPAVHQQDDRPLRADQLSVLPADVAAALAALPTALRGAGPLRRFVEAALAPVAFARSTAEGLRQLRDIERVPPQYIAPTASFLDLLPDRSLPLQRQRSELRDAARLLRSTGTVPHLRATVTRTTRWQVRVAECHQNIAREAGVPMGNLFGRRPATPFWTAADDLSTVLGFGAGNSSAAGSGRRPAVLVGTATEPFTLVPGAALSVGVDGMLPATVRVEAGDAENLDAATAAEVAVLVNRGLPEVSAVARSDGRLELRSPGHVPASTLTVARPDATLVSLEGAPRGRLSVADFGPGFGIRMAHAVHQPRGGGPRIVCRAQRGGVWRSSYPLLGPGVTGQAEPALVALPPAAAGAPPRALAVWVQDPGTALSRLQWATGVLRRPRPAVITGERSSPFPVPDGSWLVLRNGAGRRRAARLVASEFAVPGASTAAEVAAALSARLSGFALVDVAPGGRIRLTSPADGDGAALEVDRSVSTAAPALGLDAAPDAARGDWADEIDWEPAQDVDVVQPGRVVDPAAAVHPSGAVVLAYCRHADRAWQVRTATWTDGVWAGDETLSDAGSSSVAAPDVVVDATGRTWAAWQARPSAGQPWMLRWRSRDADSSTWTTETAVVPPGPGAIGDTEPALHADGAGVPTAVFCSDRGGGRHVWMAQPATDPRQLTHGPGNDSWPALVPASGGLLLLHRSDRSVSLAAAGRSGGADTGTLRRYAGSTTLVPSHMARLRTRGAWDDLLAYTPHRPEGAGWTRPLRDDETITRGAVRLFLTQVASGPLDAATAERLRTVLARVVPVNVRVHVELAPEVTVEEVYPSGADLGETFVDVHPDIDYLGAVGETTVVATGWSVLESAVPSVPPPTDPATGGITADPGDPTSRRHRTWFPPPM